MRNFKKNFIIFTFNGNKESHQLQVSGQPFLPQPMNTHTKTLDNS